MLNMLRIYRQNPKLFMKILKTSFLLFSAIIFFTLSNCSSDSSSGSTVEGTSFISVRLSDEPGDFDNVFIDVQDVMVKVNDDSESDSGWQSLGPINAGVYDLLELTGGISVLLVDNFEVPSGMLNQIRLVLGEDNSVVIDGETHELQTPSAQQSGLKIKVNETLDPNFTYEFLLDFTVDESIVIAGNSGNINLKPVIYASAEYASGIIEGMVSPSNIQAVASVEVDGNIISAYTNEEGIFNLNGIPEGTYDVTITPAEGSGYTYTIVEGVEVVNGQYTDIGVVNLPLMPGAITGTVLNEGLLSTASVMVEGEMVSATTNELGVFLLEEIPAGVYTVYVAPEEGSSLEASEFVEVEVISGETTNMGDIML